MFRSEISLFGFPSSEDNNIWIKIHFQLTLSWQLSRWIFFLTNDIRNIYKFWNKIASHIICLISTVKGTSGAHLQNHSNWFLSLFFFFNSMRFFLEMGNIFFSHPTHTLRETTQKITRKSRLSQNHAINYWEKVKTKK